MKTRTFWVFTLLCLVSCEKVTHNNEEDVNPNRVVELKLNNGKYEVICNPIKEEVFNNTFNLGWECTSVNDVFPDGSIGENYKTMMVMVGSSIGFNRFSILPDSKMKVYFSFDDFRGTTYSYYYATFKYNEEGNTLSLIGYSPEIVGCVISLTETEFDMVIPLWGEPYSKEDAIYTICRFKKLSEENIKELDQKYNNSI